jgi:hypothetical protein
MDVYPILRSRHVNLSNSVSPLSLSHAQRMSASPDEHQAALAFSTACRSLEGDGAERFSPIEGGLWFDPTDQSTPFTSNEPRERDSPEFMDRYRLFRATGSRSTQGQFTTRTRCGTNKDEDSGKDAGWRNGNHMS